MGAPPLPLLSLWGWHCPGKAIPLGTVLSRGLCSHDCHRVPLASGKLGIFTPQTQEVGHTPPSPFSSLCQLLSFGLFQSWCLQLPEGADYISGGVLYHVHLHRCCGKVPVFLQSFSCSLVSLNPHGSPVPVSCMLSSFSFYR